MRVHPINLFVIVLWFLPATLLGQVFSIEGSVVDQDAMPIPFCNVVLMDASGAIIFGTITEDTGEFVFNDVAAGEYLIKVSYVGYDDYITEIITLSRKLNLPNIILTTSAETLGEVTITAKKPIITRKSDRLVFNVENSILSNGSTMDILKSTPGVVVNQDKITVRNEGVTVYMNNRKVQLDPEEVQALLENLGGEVVKSIEVIQNPPAEYEADGGPVLNIVTSKSVSVGYKGNVNVRGTYGIFPKHSFGTSHFFKSEKVDVFFNYSFNPKKQSHRSLNFINYRDQGVTTQWDQDFERKERTRAHNANLSLDYKATEKTVFSIAAVGLYSPNERNNTRSITDVTSSSGAPFDITTSSTLGSERTNLAFDAGIRHTLEKGSLSANVHFTTFERERTQNLGSIYRDNEDTVLQVVRFNNLAEQDIEIYTGQLDYTSTFGELDFQAGAKVSVIDSRSKIDFLSIEDSGTSGIDQAQNDDFLYDEDVVAGYVSLARDWDKWSAKAGLRIEQTYSTGNSLVLNVINELDYLEWFPSAYLQYSPSDKHSISIDYSRRLERPRYQDLNPFSYFLNENNFDQGNSNLLPAFSNRLNFNYTLKGSYFFDVYYRDNGENIVVLPFQDNTTQVLRTVRQNAIASQSWGIDFTHSRSIASWYSIFGYLSAFHEEETFLAVESDNVRYTNDVDGFYAYIANNFTLSKDQSWTANVSLEYLSTFLSGSYQQNATISINTGVRKTLWNNRGVLNVQVNDLLNRANGSLTSRYLNQDNGYRVFNETQNLRVGFTYKFGNFKLNDNEKTLDKTERDRLN